MLRINPESFKLIPNGRVLKAQEYSTLLEAQGILDAAHQESQKIIEAAKLQVEEELKKGYACGLSDGQAEISKKMIETVATSASYIADFEKKLIQVIMESLRSILGDLDPKERVVRVANKALNLMRNQKQVTLEVSPEEAEALSSSITTLLERHPMIGMIEVKAEKRMKPGDCILRTPVGSVEASISMQLNAIQSALERSLHAPEDPPQSTQ